MRQHASINFHLAQVSKRIFRETPAGLQLSPRARSRHTSIHPAHAGSAAGDVEHTLTQRVPPPSTQAPRSRPPNRANISLRAPNRSTYTCSYLPAPSRPRSPCHSRRFRLPWNNRLHPQNPLSSATLCSPPWHVRAHAALPQLPWSLARMRMHSSYAKKLMALCGTARSSLSPSPE